MADGLPPVELQFADSGSPVVVIEQVEVSDATLLLGAAPALEDPKWAFAFAQMVNHIQQGDSYELIVKPEDFKAKYMETYNAEDPDEEVGAGTIRLHNFGIPDFDAIHQPVKNGDTLIFFVENIFMGIPYKVTMKTGEQPQYEPVAMVE
ncbi:MAG: hypothetical protein AAF408_01315 [Pseudomonadota bacterium]